MNQRPNWLENLGRLIATVHTQLQCMTEIRDHKRSLTSRNRVLNAVHTSPVCVTEIYDYKQPLTNIGPQKLANLGSVTTLRA